MTIPEPTTPLSKPLNDFAPVTREAFLEASSFYTALASKRPDEKLVLIRLPAELSASGLDFQSVQVSDDATHVSGLLTVNAESKTQPQTGRPVRKSPRLSNTYSIRASLQDRQVSAMSLAKPQSSAALADSQRVRLSRAFDAVWTVGVHVDVSEPPMARIRKAIQKRAAKSLVEQPKNLRMRLLPFSTPKGQ